MHGEGSSLTRMLAVRLAAVSAAVCTALVVFFFVKYTWDIPRSRQNPKILGGDDAEVV